GFLTDHQLPSSDGTDRQFQDFRQIRRAVLDEGFELSSSLSVREDRGCPALIGQCPSIEQRGSAAEGSCCSGLQSTTTRDSRAFGCHETSCTRLRWKILPKLAEGERRPAERGSEEQASAR